MLHHHVKTIRAGIRSRDKLRILVSLLLSRTRSEVALRAVLPKLVNSISEVMDAVIKGVHVNVDGVKYVLVDEESPGIVSNEYEDWIWRRLNVKDEEVFLDVGAHIGKYALRIAKTVKTSKVVAVEANPENFNALRTGVKLNGLDNVIALNLAAWNTSQAMKLYLSSYGGRHSLKANHRMGYVVVKAEPLDQTLRRVGLDKVDWIKIDVEGAEGEVFRGLRQTIERCRPHIIFESRSNLNLPELRYLRRLGYKFEIIAAHPDFSDCIAVP